MRWGTGRTGLLSNAHALRGFRYHAWWLFRIKPSTEVYRGSTCSLSALVGDLKVMEIDRLSSEVPTECIRGSGHRLQGCSKGNSD